MTTETIQIGATVATWLGAFATIVAALITARSAAKIRSRVETSERIQRLHQERLTELDQSLSLSASLTQQRYSIKAKALLEAYKLVGDVGYYIQRSVVPYTTYTPMPKKKFIQEAEVAFERLMRHWWQNAIFFPEQSTFSEALSKIMAGINAINNLQSSTQLSNEQVSQYINVVQPALATIRVEFQRELGGNA